MRRSVLAASLTIIAAMGSSAGAALAQTGVTGGAAVMFYGDNTEFRNPFREGETTFGAAIRLDAGIELTDRTTLTLGAFGNARFGSDSAFEQVRPVVALTVRRPQSTFVFGTLPLSVADRSPSAAPLGPDWHGPHALLPPLQRDSLAFERPYEAGLQWIESRGPYAHDAWLVWQRLNTPAARERFDAGARGSWRVRGPLLVPFQVHLVHEGGQLFSAGPVRDSFAVASGVVLSNAPRRWPGMPAPPSATAVSSPGARPLAAIEVWGFWSRYTPDRERDTMDGGAFLGRASASLAGWRVHLTMWRGNDFIKDEGDPNYMSIRRDGRRYRQIRDYAEAGVSRRFRLAERAWLEGAFRMHRTERYYEYSYRILAIADVRARLR